jgi:hypothetical protein
VIMITVALIAGGTWGYKYYLTSNNNELKKQLDGKLSEFQPKLIADLTKMDARLKAAREILQKHVALTAFFDNLETVTLPSIRFSSFDYKLNGDVVEIDMKGDAESFSSIALQSQEFAQEGNIIKQPSFSNLTLDDDGHVTFSFKGTVNLASIAYVNVVTASIEASTTIPQ